jgi:hypothetical protein
MSRRILTNSGQGKTFDGAVDHTAMAAKICRDSFEIR